MTGRLDNDTNDLAGDWPWDNGLLQALPLGGFTVSLQTFRAKNSRIFAGI